MVAAAPISAAGKAILLRQQQVADEDARIKALQDEEDRKFREEEAKEEAERKAIEDEKERKRKAKQDRVESQKAAGTYMTKAEKEKAKKLQDRLESMKAAGMLPGALSGLQDGPSSGIESGKASSLYGKKKASSSSQKQVPLEAKSEEVDVKEVICPTISAKEVAEVSDNWDDEEEDSWETHIDSDRIAAFVEERVVHLADDVEDTLVLDNRVKFEQLRLLGVERAKRDEENRLRK